MQTVIARIQAREGGVADVGDGQGTTYYGQTLAWLQANRLPIPTSASAAADNWAAWMATEHLDAVCDFDLELGDVVCDACVNDGEVEGIEMLQRAIGGISVDGTIGQETLGAMDKCLPRTLRANVLAEDAIYHGAIITKSPLAEGPFAEGWGVRLGGKIRRLA